jgi:hypothetical protein
MLDSSAVDTAKITWEGGREGGTGGGREGGRVERNDEGQDTFTKGVR